MPMIVIVSGGKTRQYTHSTLLSSTFVSVYTPWRPHQQDQLQSEVSTVRSDQRNHLTAAPPAEEWVFLPPSVSPPPSASPPTPSHLPTPFSDADPDAPNPGIYGPLQLFAAEYFTTALAMPFEVGKTLLQIEYRPRKRFAPDEDLKEDEKGAVAEEDAVSQS